MTDTPSFCPPERRRFVLIAAILASSMGFIDGSVVSIAIPAMRADLGASLADAQWISNSYLLLLSSFILIGGAAGDRFGIRNVFAVAIALFVLASLVCAVAPNAPFLIAARSAQGLAAAFMIPASLAIIAKAYPKEERGPAIGIWAAASSLTTVAGPIVGGLILTALGDWSWRLVFAVNLPLGALALAMLLLRVPADRPLSDRALDVVGGILATVALLLISLSLTGDSAGSFALWLLLGGAALAAAFLFWEARARAPMVPLKLFADKAFSGAQGLTFALYFALAAVLFYLPMTMIAGWGATPAEVALALTPLGIALTVLSPFVGRLVPRFGAGPLIAAGSLLSALSFIGLGVFGPTHTVWFMVLPLMALFGIGMGLVVSPLSTAVMTSVADTDTGVASGINNAVARVAGLIAVATMGTLGAWVFASAIGSVYGALSFGAAPPEPLPPSLEVARIAATDAAFAAIAYASAALALASAVIAWLTLDRGSATARAKQGEPVR